jgi:hypothetical protein
MYMCYPCLIPYFVLLASFFLKYFLFLGLGQEGKENLEVRLIMLSPRFLCISSKEIFLSFPWRQY